MIGTQAAARGVSPYLPLDMSPELDRKIQRVLVLGGKTVMRRPVPAAVVLDALPKACERDPVLCGEVRAYLQRYMQRAGVTHARASAAVADTDSQSTQPNAHGERVDNAWEARVNAHFQVNDYLLLSAGGLAYQDETSPVGTLLSFGTEYAQLDIGYRDHWLSPLNDSSSLISTQALTMPSITLSNYKPISSLGLSYELFAAEMSRQVGFPVVDEDSPTSGTPRLAGFQGVIAPAEGLAFAINRITQYGVGPDDSGGFSAWRQALTSSNNATPDTLQYDNRVASITSSIIFPGKTPFAVNVEYAGEDSAYSGSYRLGATNMSVGIDFPQLWRDFDVSYEVSEWQNDWYIHHVYPQGLTYRGHVIGHWFGDQRVFGDAIGGSSQSLRAGWRSPSGRYWQATYRTMSLNEAWRRGDGPNVGYETFQSLRLDVAMNVRGYAVEAGVQVGQDIFGDSFARLAASVDFAQPGPSGRMQFEPSSGRSQDSTQLFVDFGVAYGSVNKFFGVDIPNVRSDSQIEPHLGLGARRMVSDRSDFGVRVEFDRLDGYSLISLRALDYRFRYSQKLALNGFFGAGRYDYGLPAYGYYFGLGVQVMDLLPGWDLSLDFRHHEKLGRDKVLPGDPPSTPDRTRLFFDADTIALYLSRRW
ncbi:capsule assembly Wzi family protein [Steroidobacter cummioxidans]|uniref:capsule assembly Wzi family protein n=1 Tax=Steroidobacter cummioxidans TaxID=1803913 RepID=UPI000E31DFC7|nr:capsule assembly Wzi family protein [Steroidobacter cummioxidans]